MTSTMTILSNETRQANPDQLILRGLKKSAHSYSLYLLTSYVLAERVEYTEDIFCKCVIGILRARWVILLVLRVPPCHAREFDAHTGITFSRPATAFPSFRALILLNHDK
jgi:hypothetical protein